MGRLLNARAMQFGHPECNVTVPLVTVSIGRRVRVFEAVRAQSRADARFFARLLRVSGTSIDLNGSGASLLLWSLKTLFRNPGLLTAAVSYGLHRCCSDRGLLGSVLGGVLRGQRIRVRLQLYVIHKFMSASELATPLGKERLRACVFKVPVDGHMVSMCELNASGMRREMNVRMQEGATTAVRPSGTLPVLR